MANNCFLAVDAFCGCGGTSLGLKRAGFEVGMAIDIEPWAAESYKLNHPDTAIFCDIRSLPISLILDYLEIKVGELDLLTACPPCQGFSTLRTLRGLSAKRDARNNLIFEFLRLVDGLRPKSILFENVPGLMNNWRFMDVVRQLKKWNYYVSYDKLNAADFGVPQRRRRLVLAASVFAPIELATSPRKRKTVYDAIGDLPKPRLSSNRLHRWHSSHSLEVNERIKLIPKNGGSWRDLSWTKQLKCHRGTNIGFHDIYGRMAWNDVAPTITRASNNPSKGRFLHPEQNRALTLLESAILQSFPRSYKFPLRAPPTMIASMIGEAFPPKMAELLARKINRQLKENEFQLLI